MAKAFNPAYPQVRDGAITIVGTANYADQVFRDGTVVTRYNGEHYLTYGPGDDSYFAVAARKAVAPYYN